MDVLGPIILGCLYAFGGAFGWAIGHGAIALVMSMLAGKKPDPTTHT